MWFVVIAGTALLGGLLIRRSAPGPTRFCPWAVGDLSPGILGSIRFSSLDRSLAAAPPKRHSILRRVLLVGGGFKSTIFGSCHKYFICGPIKKEVISMNMVGAGAAGIGTDMPSIDTWSRRVTVIANPRAGRASRVRLARACASLTAAGCQVRTLWTRGPGDGRDLARAAALDGPDVVVAAGGDGTIAEVAAGLLDAPTMADGREPALGLLPLGTANVLAQAIGLGVDPHHVAAVLAAGRRRAFPVGLVSGRPFLTVASVGFDSHVVYGLDHGLKARAGKLAYVVEVFRQVARYGYPRICARIERPDGGTETLTGVLAVVMRGPYYGGRLLVAPDADPFAARLHVVMLQHAGAVAALRYGAALLAGRLARQDGVVSMPALRVRLDAGTSLPLQADGDLIGCLPATVSLAERRLDIIVPPDRPAR